MRALDPIERVLWFIEGHLAHAIDLAEIAQRGGGLSRFHLARAFNAATGFSVMGYVRARRLTEAARCLANGAPDILSVALDAGYGSHEAFTRAFRDQFGHTPEQVRSQRGTANLALVEPLRVNQVPFVEVPPPRFHHGKPLLIAGLRQQYTFEQMKAIPGQWQRFAPYLGNLRGQLGTTAYGVVNDAPSDDTCDFEYRCGVAVSSAESLPAEFSVLHIPARCYAVFYHAGHVSRVSVTCNTIWNQWLPASGRERAEGNDFLEVYHDTFNPLTGMGGVDLWIPIKD